MDYEGIITEINETADGIVTMSIQLDINGDPWVSGGTGQFQIELKREGTSYNGYYKGIYKKIADDRKSAYFSTAGDYNIRGSVKGTTRPTPWPKIMPEVTPFLPNEHPRIMFRKSDIPALRERAQTEEGKTILALLRKQLNGDETLWHGIGWGLLYQITGDESYAQKARQSVELAMSGTYSYGRYNYAGRAAGGSLRKGPSVGAVAIAYDLAYDAWDKNFREKVAADIQSKVWPKLCYVVDLNETDGQLNPRSNHYMNWNGGAGIATLAILHDSGTDDAIMERAHRLMQRRLKRGLEVGFGNRGWFYEGTYCGRFPTAGGLLNYLQALQVAEGKDFVYGCEPAQWLTTKWLYEVLRSGGKAEIHMRGMYARGWHTNNAANAENGDFARGFSLLPAEQKQAVLWFYEKTLSGLEPAFNTGGLVSTSVYSFVNWPIGLEPIDPSKIFPRLLHDRNAGFYCFRSGWQGEGDVVISLFQSAVFMGLGVKAEILLAFSPSAELSLVEELPEGLFRISQKRPESNWYHQALGVDFTEMSGAKALMVMAQFSPKRPTLPANAKLPPGAKVPSQTVTESITPSNVKFLQKSDKATVSAFSVTTKTQTYLVTMLYTGETPKIDIIGEPEKRLIKIGKRTIGADSDGNIEFGLTEYE